MTRQEAIKNLGYLTTCGEQHSTVAIIYADLVALKMAIDSLKNDYDRGYKDGEHDGYFSTLISDGREKSHYGLRLKEEFDGKIGSD